MAVHSAELEFGCLNAMKGGRAHRPNTFKNVGSQVTGHVDPASHTFSLSGETIPEDVQRRDEFRPDLVREDRLFDAPCTPEILRADDELSSPGSCRSRFLWNCRSSVYRQLLLRRQASSERIMVRPARLSRWIISGQRIDLRETAPGWRMLRSRQTDLPVHDIFSKLTATTTTPI